MTDRRDGLILGWMRSSQRSSTLAVQLSLDLVLLHRAGFRRGWTAPLAYPVLGIRTAALLLRDRPRRLVVVAPPFVAALVAVPIARLLGARVAVDIHSGALLDRRWRWSVPILALAARLAGLAVVTLPTLAARLTGYGVRCLVLPDPLPDLRPTGGGAEGRVTDTAIQLEPATPTVVAVCGWGDDEPLAELAEAARGRPWRLRVTGQPRWSVAWPPNATTTGFLEDAAYTDLLTAADLVVVLTTRDETLLSGGWEALALERPLLLSATPALVATFGPEIATVPSTAAGIAASIDAALADHERLAGVARAAAARLREANDAALDSLADYLRSPRTASSAD